MSDCKHEQITSWVLTETQTPAEFWSCANCGVKFVPITEQLRLALRLASEVEALRAALRTVAVVGYQMGVGTWCRVCHEWWLTAAPEAHKPGCLAAPKEGE